MWWLRLCRSFFITSGKAGCDAAQGIEAEFAKRSAVNWSGKPDPAQRGCAQKPKIKAKSVCQARMQSAVFVPKAEAEVCFRYANAKRI
jgi:hypothetical protein